MITVNAGEVLLASFFDGKHTVFNQNPVILLKFLLLKCFFNVAMICLYVFFPQYLDLTLSCLKRL